MQGLLEGRVAIITGSTRGIGRAMAELFGAHGATVVVNGRKAEDAAAVAATIPGALAVAGDMSDEAAVNALVERTLAEFGRIDILVNNAAISRRTAVTRVTNAEWDEVLRVNLTGPLYVSRAVIPTMKTQNYGVIVNVISGAATSGSIGFTSYAASKGGLIGLTMTWALELARFNIRVNALSPSALTDMMMELPPDLLEPMKERLPSPEDVAGAALALVSDLSKTITGQIVNATSKSA